jgi:hypothetical protein
MSNTANFQPSTPIHREASRITPAQIEKFRNLADEILEWDDTPVEGQKALLMLALVLLQSDEGNWPYLLKKENLLFRLTQMSELWACLE